MARETIILEIIDGVLIVQEATIPINVVVVDVNSDSEDPVIVTTSGADVLFETSLLGQVMRNTVLRHAARDVTGVGTFVSVWDDTDEIRTPCTIINGVVEHIDKAERPAGANACTGQYVVVDGLACRVFEYEGDYHVFGG